jgi:hypothetical protein
VLSCALEARGSGEFLLEETCLILAFEFDLEWHGAGIAGARSEVDWRESDSGRGFFGIRQSIHGCSGYCRIFAVGWTKFSLTQCPS